jgi:hypothetical protein
LLLLLQFGRQLRDHLRIWAATGPPEPADVMCHAPGPKPAGWACECCGGSANSDSGASNTAAVAAFAVAAAVAVADAASATSANAAAVLRPCAPNSIPVTMHCAGVRPTGRSPASP